MGQATTVFDGLVPASANPGVDPGAPVVVWTPTKSGIYFLILSAPDEPGSPFMFANDVLVDMNAPAPGIQSGPGLSGSITDEFQQDFDTGPFFSLETFRGAPVRAVVKVGLIASVDGIVAGDTTIVPLDELKVALGLDPLDHTDDVLLTLLESQAAAFVNSQTERNWGEPADRTEFIKGLGIPTLYLRGHIAGEIVSVRRRAMNAADFEDVIVDDYIVRGDTLMTTGARWSHLYEYEVVYSDGYELGFAPADIRALVSDLVAIAYSGLGEEGVKSETIGDYSYTLDSAVTAAAASMSDVSSATLNRYRAVHI